MATAQWQLRQKQPDIPKVGDKFLLSMKDTEFRYSYEGLGKKRGELHGCDFPATISKVMELSVNGAECDYIIYFEGVLPTFDWGNFKETCRPYVPKS